MRQSLSDTDTGRWLITTTSGSQHVLDLDDRTISRHTERNSLRKDDEVVPLSKIITCEMDVAGEWVLKIRDDEITTYRRTTPIKSIEPIN